MSKHKFKVGDTVRVVRTGYSGEDSYYGHHKGDIGKVTGFSRASNILVVVEGRTSTSTHAPAVSYELREIELYEPVKKEEIINSYSIY